ncbi:hypothetical protein M3090_13740 [Bacteroides sp. ET71]|uniref:hypothetical protein n=1 Tax=Bacteroides sp. ET71 TaxID=2939421 RepID=UPI00201220CE|nr:hypothetical protein [Bacteroides sp. ET71]MCL1617453.1 hypothetical protein [Bacteroides sp. ET71]
MSKAGGVAASAATRPQDRRHPGEASSYMMPAIILGDAHDVPGAMWHQPASHAAFLPCLS